MSNESKTILIFGISSFVGSNLAEFLSKEHKVIGTYHSNRVVIPGIVTVPCNIMEKDEVQMTMYLFKPDVAIYAIGMSSAKGCADRPDKADGLNTAGLFNVADICQRYKAQICYISSNYVFAGDDKEYVEMDIPDPNTLLGRSKASTEFYIQKNSLNYLIFRCCSLYGRSVSNANLSWFEAIQNDLQKNSSVSLDNDLHVGFLDVYCLAMLMNIAFKKKVSNRLFQVSSSDIMTYYQFARLYCETFGDNVSQVTKGKWYFPYLASSGTSYSGGELYYRLNTSNIEGYLNVKLPSVKESLEFTYNRMHGKKISTSIQRSSDSIVYI